LASCEDDAASVAQNVALEIAASPLGLDFDWRAVVV
jgi:hypothetical protein